MIRPTLRHLPIFAILLVAVASAEPVSLRAELTASSLDSSGSTHLEGPLVAFLQENDGANPDFTLQTPSLRTEVDERNVSLHAGVVFGDSPRRGSPESYTDATVQGTSLRGAYRFNVFGTDDANPPRLEIASSCAKVKPSAQDSFTRISLVYGPRGDTTKDVSDALEWESCKDGATITVRGNFRLSLWQWNATLTAREGAKDLHSGQEQSESIPAGAPDLSGTVSHDREIYLFATNGTLTVPNLTGTDYTLYAGAGAAVSAADLEIQGATGHLSAQGEGVDLQGSAVKVKGQAQAVLSGTGTNRPFSLQLTGSPDSLVVDGKALALTTAPAAPSAVPWRTYLIGVALVAVGSYVWFFHVRPLQHYRIAGGSGGSVGFSRATTRRQERGAGFWSLAGRSLKAGRYRTALLYCSLSVRLFPESLDAPLLKAVALNRLHRYKEALEVQRHFHDLIPGGEDSAALACHAALMCVKLGDHTEAVEWLKQALEQDREMTQHEATSPAFNPLMNNPWFKALRERAGRPEWDPSLC